MTPEQALWHRQAASDLAVFDLLDRSETPLCHRLHYLQMAAEKLGKAYLAGSGPPPRSHATLRPFLRLLCSRSKSEVDRTARMLGFGGAPALKAFLSAAAPLAGDLESLAPDLAGDGPNAEDPWPHGVPTRTPADFQFPIWRQLTAGRRGRQFLAFLRTAIRRFPDYA